MNAPFVTLLVSPLGWLLGSLLVCATNRRVAAYIECVRSAIGTIGDGFLRRCVGAGYLNFSDVKRPFKEWMELDVG